MNNCNVSWAWDRRFFRKMNWRIWKCQGILELHIRWNPVLWINKVLSNHFLNRAPSLSSLSYHWNGGLYTKFSFRRFKIILILVLQVLNSETKSWTSTLTHLVTVLPSYRNHSIDLLCKSIDWCLYGSSTGTQWVNSKSIY